ncbi:MAG: porin family protein, partial [Alteromonadales bacterium]|nr:porin family protein [Alteromonadales bacterium]
MKKLSCTILTLAFAQSSFAYDKHHRLGINIGHGNIYSNISSEEDEKKIAYGIFYGYQFDQTWTINT